MNKRFNESNDHQLDDTLEQIKLQRMDLVDMITENKKRINELASNQTKLFQDSSKLHEDLLESYKEVTEENQANCMQLVAAKEELSLEKAKYAQLEKKFKALYI